MFTDGAEIIRQFYVTATALLTSFIDLKLLNIRMFVGIITCTGYVLKGTIITTSQKGKQT